MPKEKSAGAVVFRMTGDTPQFLLLHYPTSKRTKREYWDFPKGHLEQGETEETAARREIQEETGLKDVSFALGFRERIQYFFRVKERTIFKTVIFFLAKTQEKKVKISFEHEGFVWLPFEPALAKLKFKNAKQILTKAHRFLEKQKQG